MKKLIFMLGLFISAINSMNEDRSKLLSDDKSGIVEITNFYQEYIQPFVFLRQSCKPLYKIITLKMISDLSCKSLEKKDTILRIIVNKFSVYNGNLNLSVLATILVYAGANPNVSYMRESLLHKALIKKANFLVKALFEYDVHYDDKHFLVGPIFFDAPDVEIAELFVNKGIDVNQENANKYNVLWHLVESRFNAKLVDFYLKQNVDVTHISEWDGTCILHAFAANNDIKGKDDFLAKVRLILKKNAAMVNACDEYNATPITVAENTIQCWGKLKPTCIEPLREFIEICRQHGGKSTQELFPIVQKAKRVTI